MKSSFKYLSRRLELLIVFNILGLTDVPLDATASIEQIASL